MCRRGFMHTHWCYTKSLFRGEIKWKKKERVLHGSWLKRFITVLQFDSRTKIGSLLTLFFRQHWDEVGNMLVSNAVYRAAKHINSSSLPVSWHIVKIVALNQSDFPKEQNVQSKQKHPCFFIPPTTHTREFVSRGFLAHETKRLYNQTTHLSRPVPDDVNGQMCTFLRCLIPTPATYYSGNNQSF